MWLQKPNDTTMKESKLVFDLPVWAIITFDNFFKNKLRSIYNYICSTVFAKKL
jgi:hypothetical protein